MYVYNDIEIIILGIINFMHLYFHYNSNCWIYHKNKSHKLVVQTLIHSSGGEPAEILIGTIYNRQSFRVPQLLHIRKEINYDVFVVIFAIFHGLKSWDGKHMETNPIIATVGEG